jgi:hypothetical protein
VTERTPTLIAAELPDFDEPTVQPAAVDARGARGIRLAPDRIMALR